MVLYLGFAFRLQRCLQPLQSFGEVLSGHLVIYSSSKVQ